MCLHSYHAYFRLSHKSQRPVTERNKSLNLSSLIINWGTQFLIPTDWIIENDLCHILRVVLEFFFREDLGSFLWPNVFPKVSQITGLPKVSKKERVGSIWRAQIQKMSINFELRKVSKMTSLKIYISPVIGEARNIKLRQQVNLIQRVPLGTPHQEVLTLPHNHVTLKNLILSSCLGVLL